MDVLVVSHTHWDREWYQPLGRMRQRLVALVDDLLDTPDGCFLLDGQSVVLHDYLRVRPERATDLAAALRSGRLEVGPWYVLADGLIPGGEALIRNLMAGRAAVEAVAGPAGPAGAGDAIPPVLYCPDSFGHPAALPDLARGFGLPLVVVWRGHGGEGDPAASVVRWVGRDGNPVLLYHLTRSGYELGASLPTNDDAAAARWRMIHAQLAERDSGGLALLLNGADHHLPQRHRAAALRALRRAAAPHTVRETSLSAFARELVDRTRDVTLPDVAGERRDSYGYTWTLSGTTSSRAAQKRANARAERVLVRGAEPWAALALALHPEDAAAQRMAGALLPEAWRTLLECHPHDTLCGCSVDEVAREMDVRLASASAQGKGIRRDSLALLLGADADAARGRRELWYPALVLSNPAARPRAGVIEIELLETVGDEPVGPGSGVSAADPGANALPGAQLDALDVGSQMLQLLGTRVRRERIEPLRAYPDNDMVRATRALVWCGEPLPAFGLRAVPLHPEASALDQLADWQERTRPGGRGSSSQPPPCSANRLPGGSFRIDNGLVEVTVAPDGAVTLARYGNQEHPLTRRENGEALAEAASGRRAAHTIGSMLGIEWVREIGDLYTHQPEGQPRGDWKVRTLSIAQRGPLRAELVVNFVLRVPRCRGASREVKIPVSAVLRLNSGSPLVHVRVRGRNPARDHRLRLRLGTGLTEARVFADAALLPVERTPIRTSASARSMESPPHTAPLHRYVTLLGERAVTVVSDGLAEYEATTHGNVLVTLVRAVGELSRNTLPNRPGHAGWPAATPLAQSPGRFAANFALLVHESTDPGTVGVEAEHAAEDVLVPPRGTTWRWLLHQPPPVDGFGLEGEGLVLRAILPAEGGVHLRCANLLDREVRGRWRIPQGVRVVGVGRVRLDGTPAGTLELDAGAVEFKAAPHETVTVALHLATSR